MSGLISVNLALAFVLCAAVIALGLWLLDKLFPSQQDSAHEISHHKHIKHKEQ